MCLQHKLSSLRKSGLRRGISWSSDLYFVQKSQLNQAFWVELGKCKLTPCNLYARSASLGINLRIWGGRISRWWATKLIILIFFQITFQPRDGQLNTRTALIREWSSFQSFCKEQPLNYIRLVSRLYLDIQTRLSVD